MPKANRFFQEGCHYHLTHRCHGRAFLFRFARDRDVYREMLRRRLSDYRTPLLGYSITSNHVHLLATAVTETRISEMMDALEGDFAQYYNLRKRRSGAFWGGRYSATAIESGVHLWRCLIYIELNMVRTGVVSHPEDWAWCSYRELMGQRRRYRLIDRSHFFEVTGRDPDLESFREDYRCAIEERIEASELHWAAEWANGLAVGSEDYVNEVASRLGNRRCLTREETSGNAWTLREDPSAYA